MRIARKKRNGALKKNEKLKDSSRAILWDMISDDGCCLLSCGSRYGWEVLPEMRKIRPFIGGGFTLLNSPWVGAVGAFRSTLVNLKIH